MQWSSVPSLRKVVLPVRVPPGCSSGKRFVFRGKADESPGLETGDVTTVVSGEFTLEPVNLQPGLSRLKFCGRYDCKSTGVSDTFTMQSSILSDEASALEADDGGVPPPPLVHSVECESAEVGAETA